MANNQPNVDADPEIEALKGKVPGIEDALPEEKPAKPAPEEKPDPTPNPEPEEKPDEDLEEKDEEEPEKPTRPEKYIPIKQYVDEKKEWKEKGAKLESRIQELESIVGGKDGSKKTEKAIKDYADKYGVEEESVRELAQILKDDEEAPREKPEEKPSPSPEDQAILDEARQIKAEKLFDEEFTSLALPSLKEAYPSATPEMLSKARKEVEKIACTKEYLDKSLDYVVFKNRSAFDKIFSSGRTGPESGRTSPDKGKGTYTAADFKDGKTPFSALADLTPEEQNKIVEGMDLKTYDKFSQYNTQNQSIEINRGGKKVRF